MLPLCRGYSVFCSCRHVYIWRNCEFWKILVSHKKLIEIWQLTSQMLTALILLEMEGLAGLPWRQFHSRSGRRLEENRLTFLLDAPRRRRAGVCVRGDGMAHLTCRAAHHFQLQPKSVRAVLWTDKNSKNRKRECGVLILRRQKLNCSFDPVLWASVPPSIR